METAENMFRSVSSIFEKRYEVANNEEVSGYDSSLQKIICICWMQTTTAVAQQI